MSDPSVIAATVEEALDQLTVITRHWTIRRSIRDGRDLYEVQALSVTKCPGRRVRVMRRNRLDAINAAIDELTGRTGKTKKLRLVGGEGQA